MSVEGAWEDLIDRVEQLEADKEVLGEKLTSALVYEDKLKDALRVSRVLVCSCRESDCPRRKGIDDALANR